MQTTKKHFRKAKSNKKSEKNERFCHRSGLKIATEVDLRLRLQKSTCATGVGLGATVSVDFCHWSGL
jgi:hypothetical protein